MARPQKFDERGILHKAMLYFWQHGYSASSIQELLDEMGISRGSLYNAIGDKEALFGKVLNQFIELQTHLLKMTLDNEALPPESRIEQFIVLAFTENNLMPAGCLMVNTLCEDDRALAPFKQVSSEALARAEASLKGCFELMLRDRDTLVISPEQAASILITQVKGARVRQREGYSNQDIQKDLMMLYRTLINQ